MAALCGEVQTGSTCLYIYCTVHHCLNWLANLSRSPAPPGGHALHYFLMWVRHSGLLNSCVTPLKVNGKGNFRGKGNRFFLDLCSNLLPSTLAHSRQSAHCRVLKVDTEYIY